MQKWPYMYGRKSKKIKYVKRARVREKENGDVK